MGFFIFLVVLGQNAIEAAKENKANILTHLAHLKNLGVNIRSAIICSDTEYYLFSPNEEQQLDEDGLVDWLSRLNPEIAGRQTSRVKDLNKSLNDSFQEFTRRRLSNFLTCTDIDAVLPAVENEQFKLVFVELKRPVEPIERWRPYPNDLPNYRAMLSIAAEAGGISIALAYNDTSVADFLLLRYSTSPLDIVPELSAAIPRGTLWKWLITAEKMSSDHLIYTPQPYPEKQHGWITYWVSMDLSSKGRRERVLIDTSRRSISII